MSKIDQAILHSFLWYGRRRVLDPLNMEIAPDTGAEHIMLYTELFTGPVGRFKLRLDKFEPYVSIYIQYDNPNAPLSADSSHGKKKYLKKSICRCRRYLLSGYGIIPITHCDNPG